MNPWKILGVNRQNTPEEVHTAYIKLARRYHPDVSEEDKSKFTTITSAYAALKSPDNVKRLIAQLKVVGRDCEICKGAGATYKQRGMTARTASTCTACEGMGIILKKERGK